LAAAFPLADVLSEAERVAGAAAEAGLPLRLLGGAGVCLHSESARRPPLQRRYGDLDFVAPSRRRAEVDRLFTGLGYQADGRFNTLNGDRRLLYLDMANARQVDVFLDAMRMSHVIDLRRRLDLDGPCLAPADLLLSKLQIYEINRKDLVDVVALLLDHPVADHDADAINAGYVGGLTTEDWGLYRTLQLNTERVRSTVRELPVDGALISRRLAQLWDAIEAQPKSLRWKVRSRVGDRLSWYELPEEVRQPYEEVQGPAPDVP
jgi:hypothetical protein